MARKTLREIEATLASTIEDKVLERLGYRELAVLLPTGELIDPRPKAREMTAAEQKNRFSQQILEDLGGSFRPATIWVVEIPRTYTPDQVRIEGVWTVQPDDEKVMDCYPLSIEKHDARWTVYLTPQRRTGLIPT